MQYPADNWTFSPNLNNMAQFPQLNGIGKHSSEESSKKDDNSQSNTVTPQMRNYSRFENDILLPTTESSLQ